MDTFKLHSTSGIDNINSKFLKGTELHSVLILTKLFKQSLGHGMILRARKTGKVVAAYKSASNDQAANFRPISPISVSSKIMEHVVYSQLMHHLEFNPFFTS